MGEPLGDPRHKVPGQDVLYPKRAFRYVASAWAGHRKSWERFWTAGLATLSDTPYGTTGAFAAEAGWRPSEVVSLKAGALRSMRLPTFTDLYYNVVIYHPNPDLKPEKAMTYRLTAAFASPAKKWFGEASVWYRRTRDIIDWEQRTGDRPGDIAGHWYSTQHNRLGTVGGELTAHYKGTGWLPRAMLSYGYLHSDISVSTDYISKYALDYMRHKISGEVAFAFLRDFTLTLTGSFYDRVGGYLDAEDTEQGYKPYFLLDGRLSWEPRGARRTGWQLYLDATNLTGTRYFDFGGLPMPGTWVSAGIVVTLK